MDDKLHESTAPVFVVVVVVVGGGCGAVESLHHRRVFGHVRRQNRGDDRSTKLPTLERFGERSKNAITFHYVDLK